MDQTILLMKETFPHLIKNNFTHQPVLTGELCKCRRRLHGDIHCASVTADYY